MLKNFESKKSEDKEELNQEIRELREHPEFATF